MTRARSDDERSEEDRRATIESWIWVYNGWGGAGAEDGDEEEGGENGGERARRGRRISSASSFAW